MMGLVTMDGNKIRPNSLALSMENKDGGCYHLVNNMPIQAKREHSERQLMFNRMNRVIPFTYQPLRYSSHFFQTNIIKKLKVPNFFDFLSSSKFFDQYNPNATRKAEVVGILDTELAFLSTSERAKIYDIVNSKYPLYKFIHMMNGDQGVGAMAEPTGIRGWQRLATTPRHHSHFARIMWNLFAEKTKWILQAYGR